MRSYLLSALLLYLVGCTPITQPSTPQYPKEKLYRQLLSIDNSIDHSEARILANQSIKYSLTLKQKYGVNTTPLLHNLLVNTGIKDRGLCYEWSDDLYSHIQKYRFKTIMLKPVGAYIGSYWSEHNALVVLSTTNPKFKRGILLDPWRDSGKLYFTPITKDPEYRWVIRHDRGI